MTRTISIERLREPRELASTTEAGNFEAVAIADLDTADYQRGLRTHFIESIAQKYDIAVAGTILVSRRKSGKLFIIDGQHRVAAAMRVGETHILAQVLDGLAPREEARMRLEANVRRADTAVERFQVRLLAGEDKARAVEKIVVARGGSLAVGSHRGELAILAVTALDQVYSMDRKGELLDRVLDIIAQAFGTMNGTTANVWTLKGIAHLLKTHDDADVGRVIEKLRKYGLDDLMRRARAMKHTFGGSEWLNFYRSVCEVYNERLPEGHRLQWSR